MCTRVREIIRGGLFMMEKYVHKLLTEYYGAESFQALNIIKNVQNPSGEKLICRFQDEEGASRILKMYGSDSSARMKHIYTRVQEAEMDTLPKIIHVGDWEEGCFVIEEFVRGQSLKERIQDGKDDIFSVIRTIKELCDAVKPLHTQIKPAIIHCDITPNNIIIDSDIKEVRLIDFDIAYVEERNGTWKRSGTPGFCAPEIMNARPCVQSDIYSIGAVLKYWIEAGDFENSLDTKCKQCLKAIVEKTQESQWENRYSNTDELKEALTQAEIMALLNKTIDHFRNMDESEMEEFNIYTYHNDVDKRLERLSGRIKENLEGCEEEPGILYAVEDSKCRSLLFSTDAVYSITKNKWKDKIQNKSQKKYIVNVLAYQDLVTVCEINNSLSMHNYHNWIEAVKKENDNFNTMEFDAQYYNSEVLCQLLSDIIAFREHLYSYEAQAQYYSQHCYQAAKSLGDSSIKKIKEVWNSIIALGAKAEAHEDQARKLHTCDGILGKVYGHKAEYYTNKLHKLVKKYEKDPFGKIKRMPYEKSKSTKIAIIYECLNQAVKYQAEGAEQRKACFEKSYSEEISKHIEADNKV